MPGDKPFYRCSSCDWSGTDPQHIKSLDTMPICPECHSEAVEPHKGTNLYDDYDEERDRKRGL